MSVRQIKRICRQVREEGDKGVVHALCGRRSNYRPKDNLLVKQAITTLRDHYDRYQQIITPAVSRYILPGPGKQKFEEAAKQRRRLRLKVWKPFFLGVLPYPFSRRKLRSILLKAGVWKPGFRTVYPYTLPEDDKYTVKPYKQRSTTSKKPLHAKP